MIFPGFPGVLSFSRFSRSSGNPGVYTLVIDFCTQKVPAFFKWRYRVQMRMHLQFTRLGTFLTTFSCKMVGTGFLHKMSFHDLRFNGWHHMHIVSSNLNASSCGSKWNICLSLSAPRTTCWAGVFCIFYFTITTHFFIFIARLTSVCSKAIE